MWSNEAEKALKPHFYNGFEDLEGKNYVYTVEYDDHELRTTHYSRLISI